MATAAPEKTEAKPKMVRLIATKFDICHFGDGTRFTTEESKKHELDAWCQVQLDAELLKIDTDE